MNDRDRQGVVTFPNIGLLLIILIAAGVRLWNLSGHGYGNIYYAAAVRSMAADGHNFLYAAFDPAGFLGLDKPPVAFWIQVLAVKLLGFSGLVLHLPQVIEGIAAVVLLYYLTRRVAGEWGGLLAGAVFALTPAAVAADRSNLADSCLVLVLLVAAWAWLNASKKGYSRWLFLGAALVGVAFNVKLLAAYIVLPTFYMIYWLCAPLRRGKRFMHLGLATVALLIVSFSWPMLVELTPTDRRPFVGDTNSNSAFTLAFGSKGFGNVAGRNRPGAKDAPRGPLPPGMPGLPAPPGGGPDEGTEQITGHGGRPGLFRMLNRDLAGHISWWLPFVLTGMIALGLLDRPQWPLSPLHQSVFLWLGWLLTYAAVFSFARAPVHPYYLSVMAPAVAALTGISAVYLWKAAERGGYWILLPLLAFGLTALWQIRILAYYPPWLWLTVGLFTGGWLGFVLFQAAWITQSDRLRRELRQGAAVVGVLALLVGPAAWSLTPALAAEGRMVPLADPILLMRRTPAELLEENKKDLDKLIAFLREHRRSERFLLATPDIHLAAAVIVETGEPAMAYGGFMGRDPIVSVERFAEMMQSGLLRFTYLPMQPGPGRPGRDNSSIGGDRPPWTRVLKSLIQGVRTEGRSIEVWTMRNGRSVPSRLWRSPPRNTFNSLSPPPGWGPTAEIIHRLLSNPHARLYDFVTYKQQ